MLWFIDLLFTENVLSSWCLRVLFAPGHVGSYFPEQSMSTVLEVRFLTTRPLGKSVFI